MMAEPPGQRYQEHATNYAGQVERAIARIGNAMYASGPMQAKRSAMRIYCSVDGGRTWPAFTDVNGNAEGGYSDLALCAQGTSC